MSITLGKHWFVIDESRMCNGMEFRSTGSQMFRACLLIDAVFLD